MSQFSNIRITKSRQGFVKYLYFPYWTTNIDLAIWKFTWKENWNPAMVELGSQPISLWKRLNTWSSSFRRPWAIVAITELRGFGWRLLEVTTKLFLLIRIHSPKNTHTHTHTHTHTQKNTNPTKTRTDEITSTPTLYAHTNCTLVRTKMAYVQNSNRNRRRPRFLWQKHEF